MIDYIIGILKNMGRYLIANRTEPHVKQKCDRKGNYYWQVYEPISGSYLSFSSEREVRTWLENRYYRN